MYHMLDYFISNMYQINNMSEFQSNTLVEIRLLKIRSLTSWKLLLLTEIKQSWQPFFKGIIGSNIGFRKNGICGFRVFMILFLSLSDAIKAIGYIGSEVPEFPT